MMLGSFSSCRQDKVTGTVIVQAKQKEFEDNPYIAVNQNTIRIESEDIDLLVKRKGWKMEKTGTGLRIEILNHTDGKMPVEGNTVVLEYETSLLDGTPLYDWKEDGVHKSFQVNKTEEIAALHEAVQKMHAGESARLIIPAHLAYGIAGDGNKIKQYQALIMTIKLTNIN